MQTPLGSVGERVFEYDNYREFLRDFFSEQKNLRAAFSHRYFAQKAGFASSSFCAHVIEGKRNLTHESLRRVIKGLGLTGRPAAFFETLVFYNQAKSIEDREHYFRQLDRLRRGSQYYKINQRQYAYYDEWYYPVIRELAVMGEWQGDFGRLGALVRPAISAEKARKAVETLVDIGLLVRTSPGEYRQAVPAVTAEGVPSGITRKTRKEFISLGIAAMETLEVDSRHISSVTVALSETRFREITAKLDDVRRQALEAAVDEAEASSVYQINFQAFPLSQTVSRISSRPPRRKGMPQ